MRRYSKVLFNIGDYGEVTVREFIFGIMILAIYCILGFWIHGKIVNKINTHNSKYGNAYFIQDNATFKQAYEVEQGSDVFVYGKLESVGCVNFSDWQRTYNKNESGLIKAGSQAMGQYSYIDVEKEHYTMHTRTVTYTDSKGHTHTRTEYYYTWDTKWKYGIHVKDTKFCDILFPYGTIDFYNYQTVGYNRNGNDRWTIRAYPSVCTGIAFLNINNKNIGKGNRLYQYQNTTEDCETLRQSFYMGNGWLILFWIIFISIGVGLFLFWAYADNDWLNRL